MEIWKDVREYEGFYQVSNFGRVKRIVGFNCKIDPLTGRFVKGINIKK